MTTLLLAEDSEMNRNMLKRRLSRRGFSVLEARNGIEAVDRVRDEQPDLVLMDLSMPERDGWEATEILKGDESTKSIPIIALTAHAVKGDREKALDAGCDDYLTKPLDLDEVVERIEIRLDGE